MSRKIEALMEEMNALHRSKRIEKGLNETTKVCHEASLNAGWWAETDPWDKHIVPTKLCLIHSEISEAMEGDRKQAMDDKLPHRKQIEVELADALIRIHDLAGWLNLDLGGAVVEKLAYNKTRADHQHEARNSKHGKAY